MKYKLIMNGLDCANCASKVENAIAQTEGFSEVSLVFATKTLFFEHRESDEIIEIVQRITDSVEDGVEVSEHSKKSHEHKHSHDHCNGECSHEHSHDHHHEHAHSSTKSEMILLIISIVLGAAALILDIFHINTLAVALLSAAAIILSGYKVFISGVKAALKLRLDETTLMAIAVIAAFALGQFAEGAMVTILFGIGELLEDKAVENSRKSIAKLSEIQADTANLLIDGNELKTRAEEIEVGSTIVIKAYERIPLDCVVTKGVSTADASAITGESLPINISEGSELLSGMTNGEGIIEATTVKNYGESTATRIIKMVEDASASKSDHEKLISRFAAIYTPIVVLIALMIAFIPPIFAGNLGEWIYRGLVCLVASCPCAIVISVPLAYYSGIGAASKNGVLIKGGRYLEALNKADCFVFDKTGTLTEGKHRAENIIPYKNYTKDDILLLAASCEKYSTHPIARAIVSSCDKELLDMTDHREQAGKGVCALYNGKRVFCGKKSAAEGFGKDSEATVFLTVDGEPAGEIVVTDTLRNEAPSVLEDLKKLGAKALVMLTGDDRNNAEKVSKKLDLTEVHASLMPSDKLDYINKTKADGHTAVFVGDGINDAPVIAAADCGFAMGLGSDAAIQSSDAVLTSGNLKALPAALRIAKKTVTTAKINIAFALMVKTAVIILAFFGIAAIWMSVIADTGVCLLCVLYAMRILRFKA